MNIYDEASQSIILAGQDLLMKMLITLEPGGIYGSNFVYLCILTLSKHHLSRSSSFGENAHNS